jgi:transcriptional regulator with XRE-family HTH domain
LALRIRELRKKYGYTQEKLAELADIDYKHIQLLEGKHPSSAKIDTLEKLAKAFKMSLSEFLNIE